MLRILGAVPLSPEGGIWGYALDVEMGVDVVPGRGAGLYSVVWLAVGAELEG